MAASLSVTRVLVDIADGQLAVGDGLHLLYPAVYDELRRLARALMRAQPSGHTLTPTALVHEAYLKLVDQRQVRSRSRAQFFAVAARAMRSILVDHARRRSAKKRGGGWRRITLDGLPDTSDVDVEVLALNEALDHLGQNDERMSRVVEMRVFAGLTVEEIAGVLEVSKRTVDSDWRVARAWLADRLSADGHA